MYFTRKFYYGGRYNSCAIIGSFVEPPVNYVILIYRI